MNLTLALSALTLLSSMIFLHPVEQEGDKEERSLEEWALVIFLLGFHVSSYNL